MSITIHPLNPADHPLLPALHDPARRQELALAHLDAAFKPFAEAAEAEGFYGYPHLDAAWLDGTLYQGADCLTAMFGEGALDAAAD